MRLSIDGSRPTEVQYRPIDARRSVAMFALVAGSVILGLFAALPRDRGPATRTLVILGALTGYHLSQVPGEGAIFYEHRLIWPGQLILGYVLWRRLASGASRKMGPEMEVQNS